MSIDVPVDSMSVAEKLQVLEQVWASLRKDGDDLPSPEWHGAVLRERSARLKSGEATVSDWDEARKRFEGLGS